MAKFGLSRAQPSTREGQTDSFWPRESSVAVCPELSRPFSGLLELTVQLGKVGELSSGVARAL